MVSIHAPAWGATMGNPKPAGATLFVSIHAPAWGATAFAIAYSPDPFGFNPRSRVGSDILRSKPVLKREVSIHAPAWGATYILGGLDK